MGERLREPIPVEITAETVEAVASRLSGAAGPDGVDGVDLRNWLLRFGKESEAQRATDDARTTPGAKLEENIASDAYGENHVEQ